MEIFAPILAIFGFVATPNGTVDRLAAHAKPPVAATARSRAHSRYSSNPEYDVYLNGRYIGSDPDLRVRYHMLQEERGHHDDSGRERPN